MARRYDLTLRAKQEAILEYWLETTEQFFTQFSPAILKCISASGCRRPGVIPPWTMQDHEAMATKLWELRNGLMQCLEAGWKCWPLKSPQIKGIEKTLQWVDRGRSNLEELMYCQWPAEATTFVYYGRARLEGKTDRSVETCSEALKDQDSNPG